MPFIIEQVSSILNQLGQQDELIISDDGSNDGTVEWVRSQLDVRIRFLENKGKKGPVFNFENAILSANGDYIYLADQDDVWLPDKLELTQKLLCNFDLVVTDCIVINEYGKELCSSFFNSRNSGRGIFKNLYKNSYIGCCMAMRRSIVDIALPFPPSIYMHDWWIGLVADMFGNVFFCKRQLIAYRKHGNNFSETYSGKKINLSIKFRRRISILIPLIILKIHTLWK
jgi:glycosyltransferase involved in cell wall biosynthesis